MTDNHKDVRISGRPIEITEDSFSVLVGSGLHVPRDSATGIAPRDSWHMSKRAAELADSDVAEDQRDALRWLRAKRGRVDFGKAYSHQDPYGVRVQVPTRPVTIQFPYFGIKWSVDVIEASGATLSEAVANATGAIADDDPLSTYPGRDAGFDRVLVKVGKADLRVADLCALIRDYMKEHSTGGALHCSLSDGNMEGDLLWEVDFWRDKNGADDKAARLIGELLMLMTVDERKALYERGYGR